jgi:hypothetical protein
MIIVVDHLRAGKPIIDIVYGDELDTDHYDKVNSIFFCETVEEVMFVVSEIRNWGYE